MRLATTSVPADREAFEQVLSTAKTAADFLSPRLKHFYGLQLLETEELILSLDRPRLLEIGVGTGMEGLWSAMKGADVTGIDVYKSLTDLANGWLFLSAFSGARYRAG